MSNIDKITQFNFAICSFALFTEMQICYIIIIQYYALS